MTDVMAWTGLVVDCPLYLERQVKYFEDDDGVILKLDQPPFESLTEAKTYAVANGCVAVANCTGVGAGKLCNDEKVMPARGVLLHYNRPVRVYLKCVV